MRIDSPIMTNAVMTGSFSGSFTGVIEASSTITGALPAGVVSGSSQIDVEQTTNFTAFSQSIADTFSGLSSDFNDLTNKPTLVSGSSQIDITGTTGYSTFSSSLAGDIATNAANFAGLDSDLSTFSVPASTTISSFGASLVDDADATAAKTTLGLENVTNESKATMFTDAALTGTPTAPTATTATDSTQIATTAFVQSRLQEVVDSAPAALDTLNELAAAINDDANFAGTVTTALGEKLVKASNLSDLTDASAARTNLGLGNVENTALSTYTGNGGALDNQYITNGAGYITSAGSISGNAATATKLATARTIAGVSFDGTANISLNNNAITNGAGYTTYSANQTLNNNSNVHFEGLMVGQTSGATANTIRCVGDVVAYYSSDSQFKDNVETLEGALDKVKAIRGVRFDWNDKQDVYTGHDIGVIAQEVEEVLPELVHHREHNDSKAVDYVKLTAVLIEAVKELSAKVEELEKK